MSAGLNGVETHIARLAQAKDALRDT